MRICVIGSGIIGLTLCLEIKKRYPKIYIDLIDENSIPSNGTSIRNSGVLHAGLYYEPGSLKAKFCQEGRKLLLNYINNNHLPLLNCGKILVPFNDIDYKRMSIIKRNAELNNCTVELINYQRAFNIQPGIIERDNYLWSPLTKVFSPKSILCSLYNKLKELDVNFIKDKVSSIDGCKGSVTRFRAKTSLYDYIFNVSGPGSLALCQSDLNSPNNLILLPILGQYGFQKTSVKLKTNLYPVPDPELPFLGVHITPTTDAQILVGPNAVPSLSKYYDQFSISDLLEIPSRLTTLTLMMLGNYNNFREHAASEFSIRTNLKFQSRAKAFFDPRISSGIQVNMTPERYGIRPQLVNKSNMKFFDDFLVNRSKKAIHVVNAISPAFTSSMSIANFLCDSIFNQ